jgi:hypothetical protein
MRRIVAGVAVAALMGAIVAGFAGPAAAEFFGCNEKTTSRVLPSRTRAYSANARYTHEFAAQTTRPRITIHPRHVQLGRNATRHCRAWLAKEYRVSGPVIVPRQECWWQ